MEQLHGKDEEGGGERGGGEVCHCGGCLMGYLLGLRAGCCLAWERNGAITGYRGRHPTRLSYLWLLRA